MMLKNETITTHPSSALAQELDALRAEQHSPSSLIIQAALKIYTATEIGYGTTYTLTPKAENKDICAKAAHELYARSPFLLAAIFEAIAANRKQLKIDIPQSGQIDTSHALSQSSHKRMADFPKLLDWLLL